MKRREFIACSAASIVAASSPGRAAGRIYRIGILTGQPRSEDDNTHYLLDGLRRLGFEEGRNLQVDYRGKSDTPEELKVLAGELTSSKPDVLVGLGSAPTKALKETRTTLPIIFGMVGDPVGAGFVESLAKPGSNVTGASNISDELALKQLLLLREAVPTTSRVGVALQPTHPLAPAMRKQFEAAAARLGLPTLFFEVSGPDEVPVLLEAARAAKVNALISGSFSFPLWTRRREVIEFTAKHNVPALYFWRQETRAGGLMSFGPDPADECRRAAGYVAKVLLGANPATLPVERPTKFRLVVNAKTARALGIEFPPFILAQADEVIR